MKKAPNWHQPGDDVNGIWKQDLLRYLGKELGINILIETGTCEGSTMMALKDDFQELHSIELSKHYYDIAYRRLSKIKNVHLYYGNSAHLLNDILRKIRNPRLLFWLDAHSSGGLTANAGDPLATELATIGNNAPCSVVVIDDYKDASLAHVEEAGVSLSDWDRHYISGEIILFPKHMYAKFPEFED